MMCFVYPQVRIRRGSTMIRSIKSSITGGDAVDTAKARVKAGRILSHWPLLKAGELTLSWVGSP